MFTAISATNPIDTTRPRLPQTRVAETSEPAPRPSPSVSNGKARVLLRRASASRLSLIIPMAGDGSLDGCTPTARITPTSTNATAYER